MRIKTNSHVIGTGRVQGLMATGSLLGAAAASSCCILPLVLLALGVSGAWIGNLTRLAPYQPYFIAATVAFLGWGYWLVYRSSTAACAEGEGCAQPASSRLIKVALVVATVLVVAALGLLASAAAFAGERTVTLAVRNVYCAACPHTVKASLEAVAGVSKVSVSYKDRTAVVTYDDTKADMTALTAATTNAGYPSAPASVP